jgi:signal transduction histidine kinase
VRAPDALPSEALVLVTAAGLGLSFVVAGLVALRTRPHNRIGPLLIAVGVLWLIAKFVPLPEGLRATTIGLWAASLMHVVVVFPTGRLGGPVPRAVVGSGYAIAAVIGVLGVLGVGTGGPARAFTTSAAVLCGLGVIGLQVVRWRASTVPRRRLLAPVHAAAVIAAGLFVAFKPVVIAGVAARPALPVVQLALSAIPLAYLVSLARRRIDRGGVAELVVRLTGVPQSVSIERALARTLHDPTLRVGYWVPEAERYVDIDGNVLDPPGDGDRAATRIDHDGSRLALLVHDAALLENPELIEATCAAAALALANERLTADLRARIGQLAESRGQVLSAAETERRRIERDLHDGVQQRLLSIPMTLGLAQSVVRSRPDRAEELIGEAKTISLTVLEELRALSQGIHPPVLTERGLVGAVRELAALVPVSLRLSLDVPGPLPAAVETTAYYVVAEALTNMVKHSGTDQGRLRIHRRGDELAVTVADDGRGGAEPGKGTGLRGLADRVEASGGTLRVDSPSGGGTRIDAVLPCA